MLLSIYTRNYTFATIKLTEKTNLNMYHREKPVYSKITENNNTLKSFVYSVSRYILPVQKIIAILSAFIVITLNGSGQKGIISILY